MRIRALALLLVTGCGNAAPPPEATPEPPHVEARETPPAHEEALPLAAIRERSSCALESVEAMCDAFREHAHSGDETWVSDGCALGPRRTSSGPFAEALLIAIRAGYERAEGDARVDRPLLGSSVREPAGHEGQTLVLLAARVGNAWFPIRLFHPFRTDPEADALDWTLDGSSLTWADEEAGSRRDDPDGYGRVERETAVVDRGVPIIAAQATIEEWHGDVDLDCTRACNSAPSPPPYPGCERQCASSVRATRSWERSGDVLQIGATVVARTGAHAAEIETTLEPAETVHLDAADPRMLFCAFVPVVHATARATARTDPESVAARDRAHAILAGRTFHEVRGASAVAQPGAPHAIVAIDAQAGTACGGGGCTTALRYRTIEGAMPEEGMHYFAEEHGARVGCDPSALPNGAPTLVEVAPAISRESIGCGFGGWDGSAEQHWVIVRVLEGAH